MNRLSSSDTPEEYVRKASEKYKGDIIPYTEFCDLATSLEHMYKLPAEAATAVIYTIIKPEQMGTQEHSYAGDKYEGQKAAVNFGMPSPGNLWGPKASLNPIASTELATPVLNVGDRVRVKKNDQAPWGAEYIGVIERINKDKTLDIRDESTGALNLAESPMLLGNPIASGDKDARRRSGPIVEKRSPAEERRDKNYFSTPAGHKADDVKNQGYPQSNFNKEAADKLYSSLLTKIVLEYDKEISNEVVAYLEGHIIKPSRELHAILIRYNLVRLF